MPLSAGAHLGPYEILAPLGAGGMGEVYRARDQRLKREVALKVLPAQALADETARKRLLHEARTASALNHPHICTIFDVGEADGQLYIAMELVKGQLLSELIAREGLPIESVARYGAQISDALAHAQERGVVHRDLKSANVMVTPEGRAKILDFGLATLEPAEIAGATQSKLSLAEANPVAGTLPYMAPEVLRGAPADARSDLWALGVLLYEMASGGLPFRGQTGFELTSAILRDSPGSLPEHVPAGIRAVIQRCLAKDPNQRYQRASEALAALETVATGAANVAAAASAPLPRVRLGLPGAFLLVAGIAVLLAALFAVNGIRDWLARRAAPAGMQSIAVLPLQNLSGDPEQEYFADGMTEALISDLAQIRALKVISRTSVMRFKKTDKPLPQIAKELGVTHIVEGSVLRSGNRVRITAQLIEAATDQHVWAKSYDRDLGDVLALDSEVARAVAQEVRVKLTPAEGGRLASRPAVKPEAYEAYLRGRSSAARGEIPAAVERFREAVALDPTFAAAFSGLATNLVFSANLGNRPSAELMPQAREAAQKSLSLDPDLAEGHTALGTVCMFYDYDWASADREFQRGVALNPGDPEVHHWYSHYLVTMGKLGEGLTEARRARELDPLNQVLSADVVTNLGLLRRLGEAWALHQKLRDDSSPGYGRGAGDQLLAQQGKFQEAAASLESLPPSVRSPRHISSLGLYYGRAGDREKALRYLAELQALSARRYISPYEFARIYIGVGDKDKAFAYLNKAYEARNFGLPYFKVDPEYDPIRSDPRFLALLKRIGLE